MATVNNEDKILLNGTDAAEEFQNSGKQVTINSGGGNDTISNTGAEVIIDSGADDDFISLKTASAEYPNPTVTTGAGKDTIKIISNTIFDSYTGNYVGTESFNVAITDLTTDDKIVLENSVTGFDVYVEDNDLHIANNDILNKGLVQLIIPSITAANYDSIQNVSVANGNQESILGGMIRTELSLTDGASVTGTDSSDTIRVYAKNNFVEGLKGKDLIFVGSSGTNSTIYGGDDADNIFVGADNLKVYGGDGDDTISLSSGKNSFLDGGDGDDYFFINTSAEAVTISGGDGADTINFIYSSDDSDSQAAVAISDLSSLDVLKFGNAINSLTAVYDNGNLILKDDQAFVAVTLQGVTSTKTIEDVSVANGTNSPSTTLGKLLINSVNVKTQQTVIKDFVYSLNKSSFAGSKAISEAIVYASDGKFTSYDDLVAAFVSEAKTASDKTTFLKNYCGIDLSNVDTGAITGYDAEGSSEQISAENIIPEDATKFVKLDEILNSSSSSDAAALNNLSDVTYDANSGSLSFTKNNLIVTFPEFKQFVTDSKSSDTETSTAAANKISIINGLYSWWVENSLDLIEKSFGAGFPTGGDKLTSISMGFEDSLESGAYVSLSGNEIKINSSKLSSLDLQNSPSGMVFSDYWDRIFARTLTEAVMKTNISDLSDSTYYTWAVISQGLAEISQGGDDTRRYLLQGLIVELEKQTVTDVVTTVLTNTKSSATNTTLLQGMFSDFDNIEGVFGYALLRYFSKQVADSSKLPYGVRYSGDKNSVIMTSLFSDNLFDLGIYNSTITSVNISDYAKDVTVVGNDAANVITALSGEASLFVSGGKGADTLYAGDGVDNFYYADGDGNDIIYNFSSKDYLNITAGAIETIYAETNNDVVVKLPSGIVTIKDAAGMDLNIIDYAGELTRKSYGTRTEDSTSGGENDSTSGGGNDSTSGGGNDSTSGGEGEDDTTSSGANDTLPCINNFYTYEGGNKIIVNYTPGEIIKIATDYSGLTLGDSDFSISSSNGKLKVANGKGKVVEVTDSTGINSVYAYFAQGAETLDGRGYPVFEIIAGTANNSNCFAAGSGGSSLWSGAGTGTNTLFGGEGIDYFLYTGGNDIIKNFQTGDAINFGSGFQGFSWSNETFEINSDSGKISVENPRDNIISLNDASGNNFGYAFISNQGGTLDGRISSATEMIVGANYLENEIYIGDGGGSLWGGTGDVSDTLIGGSGTDIFWFGGNDGTDIIANASQSDYVNIYNLGLAELLQVTNEGRLIYAEFSTGANLFVSSADDLSSTYKLADGSVWQYDTPEGHWNRLA